MNRNRIIRPVATLAAAALAVALGTTGLLESICRIPRRMPSRRPASRCPTRPAAARAATTPGRTSAPS